MVISKQLVQEINGIIAYESLIVGVDERVPGLFRVPTEYVIVLCIEFNVVLVEIIEQVFGSEDLGNLDELV